MSNLRLNDVYAAGVLALPESCMSVFSNNIVLPFNPQFRRLLISGEFAIKLIISIAFCGSAEAAGIQ